MRKVKSESICRAKCLELAQAQARNRDEFANFKKKSDIELDEITKKHRKGKTRAFNDYEKIMKLQREVEFVTPPRHNKVVEWHGEEDIYLTEQLT
jgi:hypothetical protein